MIIRNRSLYISALALDTLLLASLFILAAVIAQPMTLLFTSHRHMFFLLVAEIAVWYFISDSVGLYEHIGSRLYATHAIRLSKAVIAQAVMAVFFVFTVKETLYTRNFIGLYSISLFVFITMRSLAFRKYFKRSQRKNINLRNLLIIGSGQTAAHFYRTVSASPSFGYGKVVMLGDFPCELEVYRGGLNLIEDVVAENKFEEAVIAFEEDEGNKIKRIIQICNKYALHTYLIPDYYKFLSRRFEVAMISNFPILSLRREPLEEIDWQILKRGFDILCSLIIIITVLSWLFPIIICLQKILSPGPVFYLQDRVGKNKVKFRCIKFRSMKYSSVNDQFKPAEENDVRIT
jgi:FlaA1/EpsC-like NDP-sugar epimerase